MQKTVLKSKRKIGKAYRRSKAKRIKKIHRKLLKRNSRRR